MRAPRLAFLLGLAATLLRPAAAAAQQQGTITARATVPSLFALTIAGTQNLTFGTVVAGTPVTVDPRTSLTAGRFQMTGFPFAEFELTFTLPTVLTRVSGPGTIPIAFGIQAGCGRTTNVQATCNYFNPNNPFRARFRLAFAPNNTYFVWLGATVTPAPTQLNGVYEGTITATAVYTGN